MTLMILTVLIGPTLLFGLAFFLSQEAIFIMQDIYDKTGYINTTALQNVIHYKQITADYMIDSINIIPWIIAKKLLIDKEKNMNAIYDEDGRVYAQSFLIAYICDKSQDDHGSLKKKG